MLIYELNKQPGNIIGLATVECLKLRRKKDYMYKKIRKKTKCIRRSEKKNNCITRSEKRLNV